MVLRFLGALPAVLALVTVAEVRAQIPALFGVAVEDFVDNTAALSARVCRRHGWLRQTLAGS